MYNAIYNQWNIYATSDIVTLSSREPLPLESISASPMPAQEAYFGFLSRESKRAATDSSLILALPKTDTSQTSFTLIVVKMLLILYLSLIYTHRSWPLII
jgi:hypothetical protein